MAKGNAFLAKRDAAIYAEYQRQLDIALQMGMDAAMMAANKVLKLGKGRADEFKNEYIAAVNEISGFIFRDSKDDPDVVYAREQIDRRLRVIVGEENFEPYDVRYSHSHRMRKGN
jgi:hypothetical protein